MRRNIAVEQIYDAALDDEALRALALDLAASVGARSGLMHWVHADGSANIFTDTGYFPAADLERYATEFAPLDPWLYATGSPAFANRVLNLEELVPAAEYMRSDFYHHFVRPMGDDTVRCIGMRLASGHGSGILALHRGAGQRPFGPAEVARLSRHSGHLMRMLAMRGRLVGSERHSRELAAMLDGLGQPALLVDPTLGLVHANRGAERLLEQGASLSLRRGRLTLPFPASDQLQAAVARALAATDPEPGAVAIAANGHGRLNLSITGVAAGQVRLALILVSDPAAADRTRAGRLRSLYGLSTGEAQLAVLLADGLAPIEIAERRSVSVGTVRVQIKQIALKLGCHRQSEIVRVVAALPPLDSR